MEGSRDIAPVSQVCFLSYSYVWAEYILECHVDYIRFTQFEVDRAQEQYHQPVQIAIPAQAVPRNAARTFTRGLFGGPIGL